jgi:hypothetical protein
MCLAKVRGILDRCACQDIVKNCAPASSGRGDYPRIELTAVPCSATAHPVQMMIASPALYAYQIRRCSSFLGYGKGN